MVMKFKLVSFRTTRRIVKTNIIWFVYWVDWEGIAISPIAQIQMSLCHTRAKMCCENNCVGNLAALICNTIRHTIWKWHWSIFQSICLSFHIIAIDWMNLNIRLRDNRGRTAERCSVSSIEVHCTHVHRDTRRNRVLTYRNNTHSNIFNWIAHKLFAQESKRIKKPATTTTTAETRQITWSKLNRKKDATRW